MLIYAEEIKRALKQPLPGFASHKKMLPPNRKLVATNATKNKLKQSSVLLLLFIENDQLCTCLIKRPKHMKYHAGQIALPGGRIEKGETPIETSLRETHEEIGVQPEQIEILGSLSELYVEVSGFQIHPFVGWLKNKPQFTLNPYEVEKTVLFPLINYKNHFDVFEIPMNSGKIKIPCIHFGGEIIWGATAMILSEFYDVLETSTTTQGLH